MAMTSQFFDVTSWSNFFWHCFVSLVKFSYWCKFHVNIICDSGVMTISFYKGQTRNPEIKNSPVWVLSNIWRLWWVRNTKYGTNVSNKMLLDAARCQGYGFYCFWVIKGKPTPLPPLPLTQIRLKVTLIWGMLITSADIMRLCGI